MSIREIELRYSTGRREVDDFARRAIGEFEKAFPDRVSAYYVIGSYADGSATGISDLDLVVLFKGSRSDGERRKAGRLDDELAGACPVRLDLTTSGEDDATWEKHHVKRGSQLLYGEDIRDRLPKPPLDPADVRESFHWAQGQLQLLRGGGPLAYPLTYPDPAGEFFGYDALRDPSWYPSCTTQGLRELVNAVTLAAAALLPPEAGRRSATKGQTVALYAECVGGGWARYVEQLYEHAKLRWGYLVPEHPDERRLLRALCEQTLGFENHFLEEYRMLLSDLLRGGDPESVRFAEDRLREVPGPAETPPEGFCGGGGGASLVRLAVPSQRRGEDTTRQ